MATTELANTLTSLSPAMRRAYDQIAAAKDQRVYCYNGIRITTARGLQARGLAQIEDHGIAHQYGSLGSRGGRGQHFADWSVRLTNSKQG